MATNNPAPEALSAYLTGLLRHGTLYLNDLGETHVFLPERIPHVEDDRAVTHVCNGNENLFDIVVNFYRRKVRSPIDVVEVVAQFQEEPIIDYSVPLAAQRVLMLPSVAYIQDVAFGDSLAEFPKIS